MLYYIYDKCNFIVNIVSKDIIFDDIYINIKFDIYIYKIFDIIFYSSIKLILFKEL